MSAPQNTPSRPQAGESGSNPEKLQRKLGARHLNMIAMGGAIGTGLLVASGGSISQAGPGGALAAYAAIGFMVYLLMQSLGEMSTWLPTAGSFENWATRWISPSFGFATGWNYWFNWAITLAAEIVAVALVMRYWFPDVPSWVWSAVFLTVLFLINAFTVKGFGETEFYLALIKVVTVIVFLIVGVAMIFGILGGPSPGTQNWTSGDAPFVNGWLGWFSIMMIAGFSFQGTELIAVAAGEAENPERTIPKAVRTVFFRITLFYIGAIAVIGFLLHYSDPHLLAADIGDISISPFTLIFERAGILATATIMNAVVLTAILSAGNSGMYASSRMLYSLALSGKAPKIFTKVNKRGVPMPALLATTAVGAFAFITSLIGDGAAYLWLITVSGLSGFIVWAGIAWSHYRFRKAMKVQGHDPAELPFRSKLFPLGPIVALIMVLVIIFGQNMEIFSGQFNVGAIFSTYVGLIAFLLLWIGHKIVTRSKMVDPATADLSRVDH
ncbi:amino acid permease [Actinomyces sp. HMSC075B09]|uniref:amino acid permease n=1 Tax=Actinomyces sp. HMSC075B09 TaxID=1739358 RepID=UPI0008A3FB29|nr:amino acid permease [Actinomyces sp. HMSC075B09]OFJ62809.1 gamma-aminobutyrate permease [Actinomyces sp. HMSC075B09]